MAAPKLRGGAIVSGPKNATTSLPLVFATGENAPKTGDLIVVQIQGTTNEARWPTLSIKGAEIIWTLVGEAGKDLESAGQQTVATFVGVVTSEAALSFGVSVEASESCKLEAVVLLVQNGTFNLSEVRAAGYRESTVEGACPTPPVTGLTSGVEYLAIALFAQKSGIVKTLAGWTLLASETRWAAQWKVLTGVTTTGEPAFTKAGTPRSMTMMLVIAPPSGAKSVTVEAADTLSVAESASRSHGSPRSAGDAVTITDTATRTQSDSRAAADALTMLDAASRTESAQRSGSDGLTIGDIALRVQAMTRFGADAVAIAEAGVRATAQTRAAVEPLSVAEIAARIASSARAAGDSVAVAETPARAQAHSRAGVDTLAIAEVSSRSQSQARGPADVAAIAEAGTSSGSRTLAAAETLTVLETPGRVTGQSRSSADGISLADAAAITRIPLSSSDAIVMHDAARLVTIVTVTVGPTFARLRILRTQAELQGYSTTTAMTRTRTSTTYQSYV